MKKIVWIPLAAALLLAVILFVPFGGGTLEDGGTRVYDALTYRVVRWHRAVDDGSGLTFYQKTVFYGIADRYKLIDELAKRESPNFTHTLRGYIEDINGDEVLLQAIGNDGGRYVFSKKELTEIGAAITSIVDVLYRGEVRETAPAQIDAVAWSLANDRRGVGSYPGEWIDKTAAEPFPWSGDLVITDIYDDCFFARAYLPFPEVFKINGALSSDWCVGDQIEITYENAVRLEDRVEMDLVDIREGTFVADPEMCYKPVIYLYPEQDTAVNVTLSLDGKLTCTYPAYGDGWTVTAHPDGSLTDKNGQSYNYLYWEGETVIDYDFSRGFCVRGCDTAAFLEDALAALGLTRREANEFIVYWLPQMQDNAYNVIAFQGKNYTDAAKLTVDPVCDTLLRVFMAWYASDEPVALEAQTLTAPAREGFTVVEWGGTEVHP